MSVGKTDIHRKLRALYRNILVYGYYSDRKKRINVINPIYHRRRQYERECRRRIAKNVLLKGYIDQMISRSDSTGCEYSDYFELYHSIMEQSPRYILECGSGISSCVIACAIEKLKKHHREPVVFVSMEENAYYHEQVKRIFPGALQHRVNFVLSDRKESQFGPFRGCFYKNVPDYPYDFVFIDGPTERADAGAQKCFNADYLRIIKKSTHAVNGLLDQRITTYWAFKKLMPRASIRYEVVKKLTSIKADKKSLDLC